MEVAETCSDSKRKLSRGAVKRKQKQEARFSQQPKGADSSWTNVEDKSQANGFVDSKNKANRPKQERAQHPAKKSTAQTKEKGAPPAKVPRPTAAPYVSADVSLLQPVAQVTTRDSMPDLVMSPRSRSSPSISFRSQTESSTSSTASSSTASEAMFVQADPSDEECPSENSHSSEARSDPMTPAPRGQCKRAVTRMLEAVQILYAADRQEVLPPETVNINGSDWNSLGLADDFSNPNWNWCSSQNPMSIMEMINRDKSDADRDQEDVTHE